jgi:ribonuclease BN (tRNA processing enzyme)
MQILFLGSGGAFCDYRVNYQNNALVQTGEGPVLLDCGVTACQSLRELGVHPAALRAVLFTHLHGDHASPEQLIWERVYTGPDGRPGFLRTPFVGPAALVGPLRAALEPFIGVWRDATGETRVDGVDALTEAVVTERVVIGGVEFAWFRVPHVVGAAVDKDAYGIRIDDGRRVVWWSGDTTFSPGWVRAAAEEPRTVRIFHECMFAPPFRGTVHTHWEELRALPVELAQRVTLMHHTAVPAGLDLGAVAGAAARHAVFRWEDG